MSISVNIDNFVATFMNQVERYAAFIRNKVAFQSEMMIQPVSITFVYFIPSGSMYTIKNVLQLCNQYREIHRGKISKETQSQYHGGGFINRKTKVVPVTPSKHGSIVQSRERLASEIKKHVYTTIFDRIREVEALVHASAKKKVLTYLVHNAESDEKYLVFVLVSYDISKQNNTFEIEKNVATYIDNPHVAKLFTTSVLSIRLVPLSSLFAVEHVHDVAADTVLQRGGRRKRPQ